MINQCFNRCIPSILVVVFESNHAENDNLHLLSSKISRQLGMNFTENLVLQYASCEDERPNQEEQDVFMENKTNEVVPTPDPKKCLPMLESCKST
jgi:hypothetical protein